MFQSQPEFDHLIENLFESPLFLSKLRKFNDSENVESKDSIKTEISWGKLENSETGHLLETDNVIAQIEEIILELCHKNGQTNSQQLCL